jgi:hypothetical protein
MLVICYMNEIKTEQEKISADVILKEDKRLLVDFFVLLFEWHIENVKADKENCHINIKGGS